MNHKTVRTLKALKTVLKKTLPAKISSVMRSYEDFSEQSVPEDAKGFSAHHNACKSAVVHAETLLKLARWTEGEEEDTARTETATPVNDHLARLLQEAAEEDRSESDDDVDDET